MTPKRRSLLALALLIAPLTLAAEELLKPGASIDYSKLAFYPKRWEERGHKLELVPWEGKQVAFLTVGDGHDPKSREGTELQCFHWFLAASCAARKDLAPTFVEKWRLPLTPRQKEALNSVN